MRPFVSSFLVLALLLLSFSPAVAASEESVEALKARLEKASPDDATSIAIHIAQSQLRTADKFYIDGHVDDARACIHDVAIYSEKARDYAIQSNKHQKNVEIAVRKMSERLRDIKRTLAVEDQPPLDQAIHTLESVRTSLLDSMFSNKKEKK